MTDAVHIILVDGDPERRHETTEALARTGWTVTATKSTDGCLEALGRTPAAVVLLACPAAGRRLFERIAVGHPATPIIAVGPDDLSTAVDLMRQGAWDYLVARADLAHLAGMRDVLARARERRRLVGERDRTRDEMEALGVALQGATDGIAILATGGRIEVANRALADAFGVPVGSLVGRPLGEFVAMPDDDHGLDDVLSAVAGQGRWSGVLRARTAEPGAAWEASLTPLGGAATGRRIVGIFRDVSAKQALEQMRADFLSMVTHDIKVPLTVILGYAEMLGDPEPPPDQVPLDVVARIRESGEQIHALVCNFLDVSRIEAGRFTIDPRPFDLGAMLAYALEQHGPSARRRKITLTLDAGPLPALADEGQLARLVANLLANAIKFTPAGGRVSVTARAGSDGIRLTIADTGRGIPAADIPHLFERYRRVREAKRTEGTGLGLFIVRTIVDAHGGEIHVTSTPGAGSIFTVLLPGVVDRP